MATDLQDHPDITNHIGDLTIKMFTSGGTDFPGLKTKAAETKDLCTPLLHCWNKWMDVGNTQHKQVKTMLQLVVKLETILHENKGEYKLPAQAAMDWKNTCAGLALVNTALGNYYHPRRIMLFHYTIKWHYLLHLALLGQHMNPRLGSCYSGETMMKAVKGVVQSSHLGSPPPLVVTKVMRKYSHGLGLLCHPDVWKR